MAFLKTLFLLPYLFCNVYMDDIEKIVGHRLSILSAMSHFPESCTKRNYRRQLLNGLHHLSRREQAIIDDEGNHFTLISLNTDVLQCSLLGPLLFCIYINDISANFSNCVSKLVYADDLQLYVRFFPY